MKRFSIIAVAALCTLLLGGCAEQQNYQPQSNAPCAQDALNFTNNADNPDTSSGNSDNSDNSDSSENSEKSENKDYSEIPCDRHPEMGGTDVNEVFDITVSRVNWTENGELYSSALNTGEMYVNSIQHLPLYKFDTLEQLEDFKTRFGDTLSLNNDSDFANATKKYDDAFFTDNSLMVTYVTSGSGSNRFGVNSIFCDGNSFVIHVEQTNSPEVGTCDMAGWFITVAVPDSMVSGCTVFDADFNNFE